MSRVLRLFLGTSALVDSSSAALGLPRAFVAVLILVAITRTQILFHRSPLRRDAELVSAVSTPMELLENGSGVASAFVQGTVANPYWARKMREYHDS